MHCPKRLLCKNDTKRYMKTTLLHTSQSCHTLKDSRRQQSVTIWATTITSPTHKIRPLHLQLAPNTTRRIFPCWLSKTWRCCLYLHCVSAIKKNYHLRSAKWPTPFWNTPGWWDIHRLTNWEGSGWSCRKVNQMRNWTKKDVHLQPGWSTATE